jgi:phytoene dehydrogenase-like protein
MENHDSDVVVVGGGLAGMAGAALAARAGARTVLVEAHEPGGRARTDDHHGYRLNQGAHALSLAGAARRTLRALGVDPPGAPPAAGGLTIWRNGRAHPAPGALGVLRTTALGTGAKVELGRRLAGLVRLDPATVADRSLAEWMDDGRMSADLRPVWELLTRTATYADAPDLISADAALGQLRVGWRGVRYLDGGWQRMVDALRERLTAAGGTVLTGAGAGHVGADGDRWIVTAGDRELVAGAVILAAGGPAAAASLLDGPAPWGPLGPEVTASCLDLGLPEGVPPRHAVLFSADDPLYLSTHTPPAAGLAPPGHRLVSLIRYLRSGEPAEPGALRAQLWDHAGRAGITPDDTDMHRHLHRMTVYANLPTPATGGLAGRPPVAVPGRDGLFVAGDWVGPEGLLADAAVASAAEAARLATARVLGAARAAGSREEGTEARPALRAAG